MNNVWWWAVVSMIAVARVGATDYTWTGASGSFQETANWSPNTVPGVADNAKFTTAGNYTVSFAGDVTNTASTVGANVTLGLGGYTWELSGALAFSGTALARVGGGTLIVGGPVTVGANQKLVLDSGSSFFRGSKLETTAGGSIEVNGGEHILSWSMQLGTAPADGYSFRMTGGTLSLTNFVDNITRCSMWNGSKVALEGGTFSVRYQVDIYGSLAFPSVVDIYTNATLSQCPGVGFNVSRTAGGLGYVNIRGGSLILSNSNCNVANANGTTLITTGIINLVEGTLYASALTLGFASNGVGIVQQSGGVLRSPGETYFGKEQKTKGIVRQSGGDAFYNGFYVGGFSNSEGEVELSGGRLIVSGNNGALGKVAGSTGRLLQSGGELLITNAFVVGAAAGTVGVITNTGGIFSLNNTLNLGGSGSGAFGRALFSGPSNYVKSAINVGNSTTDTGELIVAGGSLVCDGPVIVGMVTNSTGSVRVTDGTARFKSLTVAQSGAGSLFVSGGLLAVTNGGNVMFGAATGSVATVGISGGTNLFVGQGITWAQYGSADITISGGYTYTTNRMVVGHYLSSTGRVTLSGGVLATPIIDGRVGTQYTPPGGYSEILFDGGTLLHSIDGESWMPDQFVTSFSKALVTARGAVIDSNGGVLSIPQALSNAVGEAGSFTKKGAGKIKLTSWYNAFTGCIAVEEGELAVPSNGGILLTGGLRIEPNALLNLADTGALRGLETASGTVSRVDGTLVLKSGYTLTNGVGAALSGSGTITGKVVFAAGSTLGCGKTTYAGPLNVIGSAVLPQGLTIQLSGFTADDLAVGIPLMQAGQGIQSTRKLFPVTLDGASHPYWWVKLSGDTLTLTARVISQATLLLVN